MRSWLLPVMCCTVALTAFVATGVRADDYNKKTFITFSASVQLPGVTLPAGTYTFKLADPAGGRTIIQIWNKETSHLYATLLTIPNQRMDVPTKPVVLFRETASGEPPAVQAWFYPGDRYGQEFVYPRSQAIKIAAASHQPVLSFAENSTSANPAGFQSAAVGQVDASGQFSNNSTVASAAVTTPGVVATSGTSATPNPVAARELPATASSLPLFELLSGLSLAGAFGARLLRKRMAEN